jgi:hypothetical protein
MLLFVLLIILSIVTLKFYKQRFQTAAILGSGGHTAELFAMNLTIDAFIVADKISLEKVKAKPNVFCIPRPRYPLQSWFTAVFTAAYSFAYCSMLLLSLEFSVVYCDNSDCL